MPVYNYKNLEIYYELQGDKKGPFITFINGLTQRVEHWRVYSDFFAAKGYRVLLFDLMGQGSSVKPTLFIDFEENQKILAGLLEHIKAKKAYVCGISFGGVVALRFAIEYPQMVKAIVPMSTFSKMDGRLLANGLNLYEGMTKVGFEYLVRLLMPFNFSSKWLEGNQERLDRAVRESFSNNDLYAIQNMMESVNRFRDFTPELKKIKAPALIMNGEYDSLTTRRLHEILRENIKKSRLVLMQKVCHAFTLEAPDITMRVIHHFTEQVRKGEFIGDQSVWIATDDLNSEELLFACEGDHTRLIPMPLKKPLNEEENKNNA